MNNLNNKKLSVTVGIPTCYGGPSLVPVVKSICASKEVSIDNILIISDRKPIPSDIQNEIKKMGAKVVWNDFESSHHLKIKQMLDTCGTDILVAICDDVILDPLAVRNILNKFQESEKVTLVTSAIMPLASSTFFGKVLESSIRIPEMIIRFWNKGDNYLSVSGRCMSFRVDFLKNLRFPPKLVTNDQFLYFENRFNGGVQAHAPNSIAYIMAPQYLKDHLKPSTRFQLGLRELQNYFTEDISPYFRVPFISGFRAVTSELLRHPISTFFYSLIFIYTRVIRKEAGKIMTIYWEESTSTKHI